MTRKSPLDLALMPALIPLFGPAALARVQPPGEPEPAANRPETVISSGGGCRGGEPQPPRRATSSTSSSPATTAPTRAPAARTPRGPIAPSTPASSARRSFSPARARRVDPSPPRKGGRASSASRRIAEVNRRNGELGAGEPAKRRPTEPAELDEEEARSRVRPPKEEGAQVLREGEGCRRSGGSARACS